MTKRVQIIGHDAETANQFVGEDRELTVDVDNEEIRLHDGTLPGGHRLLNRDANDERYQRRSTELDGLLGWEPNERGFTVRLGPQTYRLRSITVNGEQLTIENANGYGGNPYISWAPEITTDHLFSGNLTFSEALTADGGLDGETRGIHTGNSVGNLQGNVVGNLTGNANGDHTGTFTGDVDLRGFGLAMDDGLLQLSWLSPAIIALIVDSGLPVGSIVAFSGLVLDIPANWRICDGTNGTPDLRGRFILGASTSYPDYSTGGAESHGHYVTLTDGAHAHTGAIDPHVLAENEMPPHFHYEFAPINGAYNTLVSHPENAPNMSTTGGSSGASYGMGGDSALAAQIGRSSTVGDGDPHTHSFSIDAPGGAHSHAGNVDSANHMPPYYALIYIMKGA